MKHPQPAKHYTASVYIFSDSLPTKTLLVHHKKFDKWMMPGGHQLEHENPLEAVIREAKEETGIDITPYIGTVSPIDATGSFVPRPQYLIEAKIAKHGKEPEHYHLDQAYVVRIPEQPVKHAARESHDIRWFTAEQVDELPMFDNVRLIVKQEMAHL